MLKDIQQALLNLGMVALMLGSMPVTQIEMSQLRLTQAVPEHGMAKNLMVPTQVLELNVKVSLKENQSVWLSRGMVAQMLGLMTVTQIEMYQHKLTQVELELMKKAIMDLIQVLVSNAKASLKDTHLVLPNQRMAALMLGLMTALQTG